MYVLLRCARPSLVQVPSLNTSNATCWLKSQSGTPETTSKRTTMTSVRPSFHLEAKKWSKNSIFITFPFFKARTPVPVFPHILFKTYAVTVATLEEPQQLIVIQPVHKFGQMPKPYVPAQDKLEEAEALVDAITGWNVHCKRIEAVRNKVNSQHYFGTGKIAELKRDVRNLGEKITGVFVNVPILTPLQHRTLRTIFRMNVFDRFGIVLQIFKERAQTKEAKLQVELAEVPYMYSRSLAEDGSGKEGGQEERESREVRKYRMSRRMKQLEEELQNVRSRRQHLRKHRARRSTLPIVAVVGYTNAGKTTLIKALSQDASMIPKDMLFATLDSTLHAGKLPCGLPVLFVDTIGFISDLSMDLVESFTATLEDSMNADVLIHVIDGSHPLAYAQRANVVDVLDRLDTKSELMDNIINVVNKIDKTEDQDWNEEDVLVSATEGTSLEFLKIKLQQQVFRATGQKLWTLQLPVAGPQLSWLHGSDACLVEVGAVEGGNQEYLEVKVLLTGPTLRKFVSKFSDDITMTTMAQQDSLKLTSKNRKLGIFNV